jgi:hypothetical protein
LAKDPNKRVTSVVIHCGSGQRAFCAGFERAGDPFTPNALDGDQVITTYLWDDDVPSAFEDFHVEIDATGYTWRVPPRMFNNADVCKAYYVWMFDDWDAGAEQYRATSEDECADHLSNGVWDPTHQCPPLSSSDYCSYNATTGASVRCMDAASPTEFDYACDGDYICAVGDLSGRMQLLNITQCSNDTTTIFNGTEYCEVITNDPLSAPLFALGGRALLLECVEDMNATGTTLGAAICAATIQTAGTVVTDTPISGDDDDDLSEDADGSNTPSPTADGEEENNGADGLGIICSTLMTIIGIMSYV